MTDIPANLSSVGKMQLAIVEVLRRNKMTAPDQAMDSGTATGLVLLAALLTFEVRIEEKDKELARQKERFENRIANLEACIENLECRLGEEERGEHTL